MKKKLDYKKMVEDIANLVQTDFCSAMEMQQLPGSTPYTQDEASEMANIISSVYMVSHCITCETCQTKYLIAKKDGKK